MDAPKLSKLDPRCRDAHPERIDIDGERFLERDDKVAEKWSEHVRTLSRLDAQGAAYIYIGGIKYRPQPEFDNFRLSRIQRRNPPRSPRRGRR